MKREKSLKNIISSLFRGKTETMSAEEAIARADAALTVWPWDEATDSNPMKIATVYRCMRLLSEKVAQLPLRYLRRDREGIFLPETKGILPYLLEVEPFEGLSRFDFWRQAIQQVLGFGNAYIIPMRGAPSTTPLAYGTDIERLVLCSPNACGYDRTRRTYRVWDSVWGIRGEFRAGEVIHLKGLSFDGVTGVSVLEFARVTSSIASAGDRETRDRFRNGGNVRGFFTNQPASVQGYNPYSDKLLKEVAEKRDTYFRAGGRLSFIPGGMQFKELMMSSSDMQFLESRKFTVREICRFFGVHPSFVFDDTSNNYKSAEMANVAFLSDTLNPMLVQIEDEFRRKLLGYPAAMRGKFEFDRRGLFACDLETRVKWQTSRIAAGLDTPNEARLADNRPPVDGGDAVLMSANLKSLEEMRQGRAADGTSGTSDKPAGALGGAVAEETETDNEDTQDERDKE